jgi:hypothetical protein
MKMPIRSFLMMWTKTYDTDTQTYTPPLQLPKEVMTYILDFLPPISARLPPQRNTRSTKHTFKDPCSDSCPYAMWIVEGDAAYNRAMLAYKNLHIALTKLFAPLS